MIEDSATPSKTTHCNHEIEKKKKKAILAGANMITRASTLGLTFNVRFAVSVRLSFLRHAKQLLLLRISFLENVRSMGQPKVGLGWAGI